MKTNNIVKAVTAMLCIVAAVVPGVPTAAANPVFTDVPTDAWYYNDVYAAVRQGLINGKSAAYFAPDDDLTRAEAVALASRYQQVLVVGEVTLPAGDPWYLPALEYADEHFLGGQNVWAWSEEEALRPITRDEFVGIFFLMLPESEYAAINSIPGGSVPDVPMSDMYAAAIYTFYRAGIVAGSDASRSFMPESNIKRSEVAALLARITNASPRLQFEINAAGENTEDGFDEPQDYADYLLDKIPDARDMVNNGMSVLIDEDTVTVDGSVCVHIMIGEYYGEAGRFESKVSYAVSREREVYRYDAEEDFWWSLGNTVDAPWNSSGANSASGGAR